MKKKLLLKVDYAGRIILPKNIRKELEISSNDKLALTLFKNGIFLVKDDLSESISKLVKKLEYLKDHYKIDYIVTEKRNIVRASGKYELFVGKKINKDFVYKTDKLIKKDKSVLSEELRLNKPHYYCLLSIDAYTMGLVFIIINDKRYESSVLSHFKMIT